MFTFEVSGFVEFGFFLSNHGLSSPLRLFKFVIVLLFCRGQLNKNFNLRGGGGEKGF